MYYIYELYNDVNHKRYIGLTKNILQREKVHFSRLKSRKHTAEGIIKDVVLYGISHFSLRVIDTAENKQDGLKKERRYMERYGTYVPEFGYNGKDSRYKRFEPQIKCNDSELRRLIAKQGYHLNSFRFIVGLPYKKFIVKLNNPELFTDEEMSALKKYLEKSSSERWRESLVEINKYKLSHH